jgi:hypothetical protein
MRMLAAAAGLHCSPSLSSPTRSRLLRLPHLCRGGQQQHISAGGAAATSGSGWRGRRRGGGGERGEATTENPEPKKSKNLTPKVSSGSFFGAQPQRSHGLRFPIQPPPSPSSPPSPTPTSSLTSPPETAGSYPAITPIFLIYHSRSSAAPLFCSVLSLPSHSFISPAPTANFWTTPSSTSTAICFSSAREQASVCLSGLQADQRSHRCGSRASLNAPFDGGCGSLQSRARRSACTTT